MDGYAPLPTPEQLQALEVEFGAPLTHGYRVEGGLGGTIDVLISGDRKVVLRRFWLPEPGEPNPAEGEARALVLAARHGIPAPEPLWVDRIGLFPERAILLSFVEGRVNLSPADPLDWAAQLADVLIAIHRMQPSDADAAWFLTIHDDDDHIDHDAVMGHRLGSRLWEARREAARRLVPVETGYVHHDFWPGNTLWVGENLSAVVDWEGGGIGDPALDVAYCSFDMRMLGLDHAADHFLAVYRERSGRDLANLGHWYLSALCRPMPDIAVWLPSWTAAGVDITSDEARRRHETLIEQALRA
jgi:aminoglycoside phosphotransferase (APT) family kinase protein